MSMIIIIAKVALVLASMLLAAAGGVGVGRDEDDNRSSVWGALLFSFLLGLVAAFIPTGNS